MADAKRPTAQDIEDFRQVLDGGMRQSLGSDTTTPDHAAVVWQMWVRFTGVLDYAADCLRAEEEGERVPEVETPEDAGEYPCAGGCGTMLEPPFAPGDTCGVCAAVAQMMAGRDIATIKLLRSELSAARWTIRKALALLDCGNVEHARRTLAHVAGLDAGPVYGGEE